MSGKNLELSLVMRLRDLASSGVTRSQRIIQDAIGKTEKSTASLTQTVAKYQKTHDAAAILGIRSERNIQREIWQTEAAYNRLARSGTMSMRDQARAAEATRKRIRELNNEMGKFTLGQKAMGKLQAGAAVAGGMAAGGYVLGKPIGQTMDYSMQLAYASNTAFSGRDTIGKIAGKRELNKIIEDSVRSGGGDRDSAVEALNSMVASGVVSANESKSMLPVIMKGQTATRANATDLAQIVIRAKQSFGLNKDQMGTALDMANAGGKAGSFELKDMAKHLPAQMAAASLSGMTGIPGLAKLIAANQAAAITAGSSDEAGINVKNLLLKLNSSDTAQDARKLGINLSGTLSAARAKGIDSLDAFIGIIHEVTKGNKEYQALQGQLKTAKGPERRAILESQTAILQGSVIGQILQDREALSAAVGIMGNPAYMKDVLSNVMAESKAESGKGSVAQDFAVISKEPAYQVQQAANEKIFATQTAFEHLTPLIGSVSIGFTEIAKEYPNLTMAAIATTTALTALAAAAVGMAGITTLLGGKAAAGGILGSIVSKTASGAGGILGRGAMAAGGFLGRGALSIGGALVSTTAAGALVAGTTGYGIGTMAYEHGIKGTSLDDKIGGMIATIMASLGDKEAQKAIEINLHLDGEQIASVVHKRDKRDASRY